MKLNEKIKLNEQMKLHNIKTK